jgi:hypothetical protein
MPDGPIPDLLCPRSHILQFMTSSAILEVDSQHFADRLGESKTYCIRKYSGKVLSPIVLDPNWRNKQGNKLEFIAASRYIPKVQTTSPAETNVSSRQTEEDSSEFHSRAVLAAGSTKDAASQFTRRKDLSPPSPESCTAARNAMTLRTMRPLMHPKAQPIRHPKMDRKVQSLSQHPSKA